MDESAKTEARNYLCAAGFFLLAAWTILRIFINTGTVAYVPTSNLICIVLGAGFLIAATLLIVLRRRDMIAVLFFLMGFYQLFFAFTDYGYWNVIMVAFILLAALVTLVAPDKKKWMLFLFPALWAVYRLISLIAGFDVTLSTIFFVVLAVICLYYSFCCACERIRLPGAKLLTADETTDFKASGSVLGYLLFALLTGGYALHYILGERVLPIDAFVTVELLAGSLMIFLAILLLTVGKMRFTPVMFLLMGLLGILSMFSSGTMFFGIGILWVVIGVFALLRKESRFLPGIMLMFYGCTLFLTEFALEGATETPVSSALLNAIPCLIAIYLAFAVYSQGKLSKF